MSYGQVLTKAGIEFVDVLLAGIRRGGTQMLQKRLQVMPRLQDFRVVFVHKLVVAGQDHVLLGRRQVAERSLDLLTQRDFLDRAVKQLVQAVVEISQVADCQQTGSE